MNCWQTKNVFSIHFHYTLKQSVIILIRKTLILYLAICWKALICNLFIYSGAIFVTAKYTKFTTESTFSNVVIDKIKKDVPRILPNFKKILEHFLWFS
jgi:hypothetical protein